MQQSKLVVLENPKSPIAEAYRIARTNIQFAAVDKDLKTFLITSSGPSEGKSTTAANLSIAFAQAGKSVLLIDADLRKPTQHKIWDFDNSKGLTNILLGDAEISRTVQPTPMNNLHVLTTGPIPPNPSEMMGSQRMSQLLKKSQEFADIIIIDSPPIIAVTDAALLASQVDGVVLVVAVGQARIESAQRAKKMLINGKATILGTILNMVEEDSEDYYYYYYYVEGDRNKKKGKHRNNKVASL